MATTRVMLTIDSGLISQVDRLVAKKNYPNRDKVIEEAVREQLLKLKRRRLALECGKLEPRAEQKSADDGLCWEHSSWPIY